MAIAALKPISIGGAIAASGTAAANTARAEKIATTAPTINKASLKDSPYLLIVFDILASAFASTVMPTDITTKDDAINIKSTASAPLESLAATPINTVIPPNSKATEPTASKTAHHLIMDKTLNVAIAGTSKLAATDIKIAAVPIFIKAFSSKVFTLLVKATIPIRNVPSIRTEAATISKPKTALSDPILPIIPTAKLISKRAKPTDPIKDPNDESILPLT